MNSPRLTLEEIHEVVRTGTGTLISEEITEAQYEACKQAWTLEIKCLECKNEEKKDGSRAGYFECEQCDGSGIRLLGAREVAGVLQNLYDLQSISIPFYDKRWQAAMDKARVILHGARG